MIKEENEKQKAFGLKFALANRRRRREESKRRKREGRRKKRKKKEEKWFKNQVCLCLRIMCMGFLGLGYGD